MEQRKEHYLDKVSFINLLEYLIPIVENKKRTKKDIILLNEQLNKIIETNNLDKQQLISKWISINSEQHFNQLKVTNLKDYFSKLGFVFKSSAMYMNKTNDPLYLLAQLSILTDWYLYRKINLNTR